MLKKFIYTLFTFVVCSTGNLSIAQSDSTDLSVYMSDASLFTAMDSILYGDGSFEELNLDFSVSDTVTFSKVHIEILEVGANTLIFKKAYQVSDLETASLIDDWDVSIPFGNLLSTSAYKVSIIVERYDGALGLTISKTLNP